jgi:hypothetical protein
MRCLVTISDKFIPSSLSYNKTNDYIDDGSCINSDDSFSVNVSDNNNDVYDIDELDEMDSFSDESINSKNCDKDINPSLKSSYISDDVNIDSNPSSLSYYPKNNDKELYKSSMLLSLREASLGLGGKTFKGTTGNIISYQHVFISSTFNNIKYSH